MFRILLLFGCLYVVSWLISGCVDNEIFINYPRHCVVDDWVLIDSDTIVTLIDLDNPWENHHRGDWAVVNNRVYFTVDKYGYLMHIGGHTLNGWHDIDRTPISTAFIKNPGMVVFGGCQD